MIFGVQETDRRFAVYDENNNYKCQCQDADANEVIQSINSTGKFIIVITEDTMGCKRIFKYEETHYGAHLVNVQSTR